MAIQMSIFDNFDIHQMSSKFAQIQFLVSYFHYKKISILGSLNYAENCQKTTFFGTPNINTSYGHSRDSAIVIVESVATCNDPQSFLSLSMDRQSSNQIQVPQYVHLDSIAPSNVAVVAVSIIFFLSLLFRLIVSFLLFLLSLFCCSSCKRESYCWYFMSLPLPHWVRP